MGGRDRLGLGCRILGRQLDFELKLHLLQQPRLPLGVIAVKLAPQRLNLRSVLVMPIRLLQLGRGLTLTIK